MSQFITPMQAPYNAACDGVTDDSIALQAWLNALPSTGKGAIPPGRTSRWNGILTVPSGAHWEMYGATLKAIDGADGNTCICIGAADQISAGPSDVSLSGGTIDGNIANRSGPYSAANIYIMSAHSVRVRDMFIKNGVVDCIYIGGDSRYGGSSSFIWVDNVRCLGAVRNVVSVVGAQQFFIDGCFFQGAGELPGIGLDLEPDNIYTSNINFDIGRCFFYGNGGHGLSIGGAGNNSCGKIHDCVSMNNGDVGFYQSGSNNKNNGVYLSGVSGSGNAGGLFGGIAVDRLT